MRLRQSAETRLPDWTKGQHSNLQKMHTVIMLVLWAVRPDESHVDRKTF